MIEIRHNFFLLFTAAYLVLIPVGLGIALLVQHLTSYNIGNLLGIVCFCVATQFAVRPPANPLLHVYGAGRVRTVIALMRQRHLLAIAFAVIAVTTDFVLRQGAAAYLAVPSDFPSVWRLGLLCGVYAVLAYWILGELRDSAISDPRPYRA